MKNVKWAIVLISCLVLRVPGYCQQDYHPTYLTSADYIKKSKNQQAAGWLMLGGGIIITTVGLGIFFGKVFLGCRLRRF
jgi:hypothetical protein